MAYDAQSSECKRQMVNSQRISKGVQEEEEEEEDTKKEEDTFCVSSECGHGTDCNVTCRFVRNMLKENKQMYKMTKYQKCQKHQKWPHVKNIEIVFVICFIRAFGH